MGFSRDYTTGSPDGTEGAPEQDDREDLTPDTDDVLQAIGFLIGTAVRQAGCIDQPYAIKYIMDHIKDLILAAEHLYTETSAPLDADNVDEMRQEYADARKGLVEG